MKQPSRTFTDTSPTEELQHQPQSTRSEPSQEKSRDLGLEPEPEVRVRYMVSVEHLIHLENAQCGAKSVINVAIKIILALHAGPNNQEEGIEDPTAHPEDAKAKVNVNSPGLEATR